MDKDSDIAIKVENLNKSFRLPHQKQSSLKGMFLSSFQRKSYETQHALKNINFEIKNGEFYGIVGRNGSGKSTLLKLIAGIYTPDSGKITVNGSLTPFIELGVGFTPDLSGRENVYLNGALLGLARKEIDEIYDDIVDFAELRRFMDQKLNNYSSGMQVRLAFSIAIRAHSDMLLLDEVLAVGDSAFQQKCFDYFASLKRDKKTIILVSHAMPTIEQFCDKALLLEANEIKHIGTSSEIAGIYEDMILKEEAEKRKAEAKSTDEVADASKRVDVKVSTYQGDKRTRTIEAYKEIKVVVTVKSTRDIPRAVIGVNIRNSQGQILFSNDTKRTIGQISFKKNKAHKLTLTLENIFTNGIYSIAVILGDGDDISERPFLTKRNIAQFSIYGIRYHIGSLMHPKGEFDFSD